MRSDRRWRQIFKRDPRAEVQDELAFHFEQRVRDNMARGMDEASARRAAHERLGDLRSVQAECTDLLVAERREEARRDWLKVSWLDFKLGFRMLVKYPGLTVVGGLAMAFAIWVGAGGFEVVRQIVAPQLPLPDGDRIVGIVTQDAQRGSTERRVLFDVNVWQTQLRTITDVGAYRTIQRNLAVPGLGVEPAEAAEVGAVAFRVARVSPLMGRTLTTEDEQPGAPAVAVIGYDLWQQRFGGDARVVGRTVQFGRTPTEIVGVMPEGFGFPIAHDMWVPMRVNAANVLPREGPSLRVFGRLAEGASLDDARAELAALTKRLAADHADTHTHLRPEVLPYAKSIINIPRLPSALIASSNVLLLLLLALICGNVALLMFARAASRETELVVRSALGASRGRITTQLFAEALVLGIAAAVVGLLFASTGLKWMMTSLTPELAEGMRTEFGSNNFPFWFRAQLSPTTIAYALLLTMFGALIMGVLPALKVTRGLQSRLRAAAAGGGGIHFGGVWTVLIVAQVAVTVAFPFFAYITQADAKQIRARASVFASSQYLTARVEMDRENTEGVRLDSAQLARRFNDAVLEVNRRLAAEPSVVSVTFGDRLPLMYHPHRLIEVDAGGSAPPHRFWPGPGYRVSSATVDPHLFETFGARVVDGRPFAPTDIGSDHHVIIVNRSFVAQVLGNHNPIGRRVRHLRFEEDDESILEEQQRGPWYEIVGVVDDLGNSEANDPKVAGFYHPASPAQLYPLQLAVRVRGDAQTFTPRLREIAAAVDPSLRVYEPMRMSALNDDAIRLLGFWFRMILLVSAVGLVLSLAGIYAVMAFTVARRTREIGVRVALGANARGIVLSIFRRPLLQMLLGIAVGLALLLLFVAMGTGGMPPLKHWAILAAYGTLMLGVCMTACVVPTRRALGVQPLEALRQD
jgi:putative ABC transport system permease protein